MASPADAGGSIRPARGEDAAAVTAVVRAAYAPFVPLIGREPGPMGDDYAALIAAGLVHVLDEDGRIVGVLVLVDEPSGLLLDNVVVAPQAQGRGHGRRLIAFAEAEARRRGHATVRLYTNVLMTANIALYGRLGYRETDRRVESGYHRVFMAKRL
jgi:ribosomal protein S18 acetylase RimI-like enzyme